MGRWAKLKKLDRKVAKWSKRRKRFLLKHRMCGRRNVKW